MKKEIRICGFGGQGVILSGFIIGKAASVFMDYHAVQSQSYGPEARGGASRSDVVISDEDIDYPKAEKLDVLLTLTQQSYNNYHNALKPNGLLIYDADHVQLEEEKPTYQVSGYSIIRVAREYVGKEIVANIVALGIIAEQTKIVSKESIENAVLNRVPKGTESLNRRAIEVGYKLASGQEI